MLFGIKLSKTRPFALMLMMMLAFQPGAFAGGPPKPSSIDNPLAITMIIIMAILLLAIGLLANVVLGAAGYFHEKQKEALSSEAKPAITPVVIGLLLLSMPAVAQDATTTEATTTVVTTI